MDWDCQDEINEKFDAFFKREEIFKNVNEDWEENWEEDWKCLYENIIGRG